MVLSKTIFLADDLNVIWRKEKMYLLKNNFHNTEYRTQGGILSPAIIKKIRKKLCGQTECQCGNELGMCGPQCEELFIYEYVPDTKSIEIIISSKNTIKNRQQSA